MTSILAAAPNTSQFLAQVSNVPVAVFYAVAVVLFLLISWKMGKATLWHIIAAYILGVLSLIAFPDILVKMSDAGFLQKRLTVDAIFLVAVIVSLILAIRDKRK